MLSWVSIGSKIPDTSENNVRIFMLSFVNASINAQSYFAARLIPFSDEITQEERSSLFPHINITFPGEVNSLAFEWNLQLRQMILDL